MSDIVERLVNSDNGTGGGPTGLEASAADEITRLRSLLKDREWRDISTAPKDGTWVLLSGGRTSEDFYLGDIDRSEYRQCVCAWMVDAWVFCFWDGDWRSSYENPTHWMPLPPPPEENT